MVSSPTSLTARQQQILRLIRRFIAREGLPPTRADLARALQLRNRQGIEQHLRALERKGHLRLEPGIARGIRVLGEEALADSDALALAAQSLRLPLYGRVAAGVPTFADSNIEELLAIDRALFRPRADFLLRVHGWSMRDAGIAHRDILAVHRTPQNMEGLKNGQIVVARLGEEATVKYFHRQGTQLRLEPANPEFTPIQIDLLQQDCQIEGVVVGSVRTQLPANASES